MEVRREIEMNEINKEGRKKSGGGGERLGNQLARAADLNIDSFYLNSVPLSPAGYLPLELDAITKSEMAPRSSE